jgi:hypothetical protein
MKPSRRTPAVLSAILGLGIIAVTAGWDVAQVRELREEPVPVVLSVFPGHRLEARTEFPVKLSQTLSSKTSYPGMEWTGVVAEDVRSGDRVVIPRGCEVRGEVVAAREARRGGRAMLDLAVRSVSVDGRTTALNAHSEPVVANSTRARNFGAIAGGIAAGALLGSAIGGDGKDAAIGGLLGGAAATGVVASSQGYQVILEEGSTLDFVIHRRVAMR